MMKTKFLLAAIALPLAFTACTSEDVIEAGNGQLENLESRAALGDITFVAGNVDSRVTTDGKGNWSWEDTDKFSAHLIDATKFSVAATDTALYTNYIYTKGAEGYTTTSQMVEGMYWFYAPAKEGKNDREMIKYALPKEQTMDAENPDAHIVENSIFFSPIYKMEAKNNEANVSVPLTMYNWYTVALIPFTNDTKEDLNIQKIVLKTTSALAANGKINAGAIAQKFLKVYDAEEEAWVDYTDANGNVKSETPMSEDYFSGTEDDYAFILNVEKTLAPKETFTAKMLVPAGGAGICTVTVIMDNGEGATFTTNDMQFNHHAQKAVFGVSNGKPNAKKIKTLNAVADNYVMNNEDIIDFLSSNTDDVTLSQVGEWNVNADALAAIAAYTGEVEFDKDITIENETAKKVKLVGLNNNFTLKGGNFEIANYNGNITIEAGELDLIGTAYATITNKGGKITVKKASTVATAINNNKGQLVFAANNTIGATGIVSLTNGVYTTATDNSVGEITVNASKVLTMISASDETVMNTKLSKWTVNGKISNNNDGRAILNHGEIVVAEGAKIESNNHIVNYGTVKVSGEISGVYNNGNMKAEAATARLTVSYYEDANWKLNEEAYIDNTVLAYVSLQAAGGYIGTPKQIIFYQVNTAVDNDVMVALDKNIKGYGINALKFSAAVSLNGRITDANGNSIALTGVNRLIFASGSSLKLGNNTAQELNVDNIDIEASVSFTGYDNAKSLLGLTKTTAINVASGATLSLSHITVAGISEITAGGTTTTVTAPVNVVLKNKLNAGFTTWGCIKNEGDIRLNGGAIYSNEIKSANEIVPADLVKEATTARGANWIGADAQVTGVAVTVAATGEITWN